MKRWHCSIFIMLARSRLLHKKLSLLCSFENVKQSPGVAVPGTDNGADPPDGGLPWIKFQNS